MLAILKAHVLALFRSLNRADATAVADTLEKAEVSFGFPRNGNVTTFRTSIAALKGEPSKRVSLDSTTDGTRCVIVQRMQADCHADVFAALVHGAILLWRDVAGERTADGKKRLIDESFTSLAGYVGLTKIADERITVKDGKESKSKTDKMARVWFGLSQSLAEKAEAFAAEAGPLPAAFVGTVENTSIGTILLPGKAKLASGAEMAVFFRVPSWTAAVRKMAEGKEATNKALDVFNMILTSPDVALDPKNKGYKLLLSLKAEAEAPVEKAPAKPKAPPKARKPKPAPVEAVEAAA